MSQKQFALAEWTNRVRSSPTGDLEAKVELLTSQGVTLFRLGMGEPDFHTPDHVKAAAITAIDTNRTGYTSTGGIMPLRQAIIDYLERRIGLSFTPSEIVVSAGAKQAIFNAILALCRAGDEVLIPIPYWVSFPEQVLFAGAVPVSVPTSAAGGHKVTPETLADFTTPATRLLILNSPNNPSGAVYSADELNGIAQFCVEHDLWVISDEVYNEFTYGPATHVSIATMPGMRERTIVINAASKTYSMTGWRIGYAAAPAVIAEAMVRLQSHTTSNPNSIAQHAAVKALASSHDWLIPIRAEFEVRRRKVVDAIRAIPGLEFEEPDGAFFVWVDMSAWCGQTVAGRRITNADDLAAALLEAEGVVVMPGTGFGHACSLRLSFAAAQAELDEGLKRMAKLLANPLANPHS